MEIFKNKRRTVVGKKKQKLFRPKKMRSSESTSASLPAQEVDNSSLNEFISCKWEFFVTEFLRCPIESCGKKVKKMSLLNRHMKDAHNILKFRCHLESCGKSFQDKDELKAHVDANHSDVTNWNCTMCPNGFSDEFQLQRHYFFVHSFGRFKCIRPGCKFTSSNRIGMMPHANTGHRPATANVSSVKNCRHSADKYTISFEKCLIDDCFDFFLTSEALDKHLKVKHELQPIICPVSGCQQSFANRKYLTEHTSGYHKSIRNWNCGKCDVVLSNGKDLFNHQHRAHGEGGFRCPQFGCEFIGKYRSIAIEHFDRWHGTNQTVKREQMD